MDLDRLISKWPDPPKLILYVQYVIDGKVKKKAEYAQMSVRTYYRRLQEAHEQLFRAGLIADGVVDVAQADVDALLDGYVALAKWSDKWWSARAK